MTSEEYRSRAARARRLALCMTGEEERAALDALAEEYNDKAYEIEAARWNGRERPPNFRRG